ncbi:MAG: hypothetical protein AB8H80_15615 [Planctomycetota bacterium]
MTTGSNLLALAAAGAFATATATAQFVPVPLNYNFNGVVHAGESGQPDDPNGFRSISDRALDFTAGIPVDPLLAPYQLIAVPGVLDVVHLGNRNTVDGGLRAFDALANGDDRGIQPSWILNVDQSTPQTTTLATPLPLDANTKIAFLYQISNGGGSFDVTFGFFSGQSATFTLSGGDWFGGPYPGAAFTDSGIASAAGNLSIVETRLDVSAFAGEVVDTISFANASNTNAGIAVLACNFEFPPEPSRINQIALSYNFNGIVHAGESGLPDDLIGYRSISDRGLDFTAGVPADPILDSYRLVDQAQALDIVHLGDRNTVDGGSRFFDAIANGDDLGVQPAWLPSTDQTGPQQTTLADPIVLDSTSSASLVFLISNGGGSFDVEFQFASGAPLVATVSGADWFGGALPGTANTDTGLTSANLTATERSIDLTGQAGRTLTGIAFQNASNANAGYAILAMNVIGCLECANGAQAQFNNLGGGTGATIAPNTTANLGCDLEWVVSGATPGSLGLFAIGSGTTSVPLALVTPGCPGTIHVPNPILLTAPIDGAGSARLVAPVPGNQALCGFSVTAQHAELALGACFLVLSDALEIRIGN